MKIKILYKVPNSEKINSIMIDNDKTLEDFSCLITLSNVLEKFDKSKYNIDINGTLLTADPITKEPYLDDKCYKRTLYDYNIQNNSEITISIKK